MGLSLLKELPIKIWVLLSEVNAVVQRRCEKLGLPYIQGLAGDKRQALLGILDQEQILLEEVVYVGNDVNAAWFYENGGLLCNSERLTPRCAQTGKSHSESGRWQWGNPRAM